MEWDSKAMRVVAAMLYDRGAFEARREYVQLCRESAIEDVSCAAASPTIAATSLARMACLARRSVPEVFAANASASSLAIVPISLPSLFTNFCTLRDHIRQHKFSESHQSNHSHVALYTNHRPSHLV
jgi:hypothetical protein